MMRRSAIGTGSLALIWAMIAPAAVTAQTVVPTRYIADRFFATPVTTTGDTLVLLIDSGGGGVWVMKPVLERLGITPKFVSIQEGDSVFRGGRIPSFMPAASIPSPLGAPNGALIGFGAKYARLLDGGNGMLGHTWLAGRTWVFDYPQHQLSYFGTTPAPRPFGPHTIPMTLKNPLSRNDPRIQVGVDGDTVDMLLDTGATSELTPDAIKVMGSGPAIRSSAFAATRLWNGWRAKHPEWRVLSGGEANTKLDFIEVPTISIGGYDVGPVWFARRPDSAYDVVMNAMMDKPILASIGGPALKYFRITMDYPNQRATFEKP